MEQKNQISIGLTNKQFKIGVTALQDVFMIIFPEKTLKIYYKYFKDINPEIFKLIIHFIILGEKRLPQNIIALFEEYTHKAVEANNGKIIQATLEANKNG